MIKHHPSPELLEQFTQGTLPASVAVIVSAHVEMCSECQQNVTGLTEKLALQTFEATEEELGFNLLEMDAPKEPESLALIESITSEPVEPAQEKTRATAQFEIKGEELPLPNALKSLPLKELKGLGAVSRARVKLDDDQRRTSLLHIEQGGQIPYHSHRGFEITLLLHGSFEDEYNQYQQGDFIWLDGNHTHSPVTHEGCVCLTVSSDSLIFKQGLSKLMNPIGQLIY